MVLDEQHAHYAMGSLASAGGTITVGRKRYAVGLFWQPSPSGRVSQAAREAARQPGQMADFFAVRPGTQAGRVAQFSLGQREMGHTAGLPSAAASVAEEQPGSWGGVFKVEEGWWLVVIRDDLIAPDGDVLFDEEAPARQRLQDEISLGGLQRLYAPEHWRVASSDPMPLSLLLQGRATAHLQNVKLPIKSLLVVIGGLVFLAIIGYMLFAWQQQTEAEKQALLQQQSAEQQRLAELQRQNQLLNVPPPPPPKRAWEDAPLPEIWLDACRQAMAQVRTTAPGWTLKDVSCAGKSLTISWVRGTGGAVAPQNGTIAADGNSASSVYPLLDLPARGVESLGKTESRRMRIMLHNLPIGISDIPDPPPPPLAPGEQPPPPPPWVKKKITLKSQTAPWYVWQSYMGMSGIVLEQVNWNLKDWTIEGTLYEVR